MKPQGIIDAIKVLAKNRDDSYVSVIYDIMETELNIRLSDAPREVFRAGVMQAENIIKAQRQEFSYDGIVNLFLAYGLNEPEKKAKELLDEIREGKILVVGRKVKDLRLDDLRVVGRNGRRELVIKLLTLQ